MRAVSLSLKRIASMQKAANITNITVRNFRSTAYASSNFHVNASVSYTLQNLSCSC